MRQVHPSIVLCETCLPPPCQVRRYTKSEVAKADTNPIFNDADDGSPLPFPIAKVRRVVRVEGHVARH